MTDRFWCGAMADWDLGLSEKHTDCTNEQRENVRIMIKLVCSCNSWIYNDARRSHIKNPIYLCKKESSIERAHVSSFIVVWQHSHMLNVSFSSKAHQDYRKSNSEYHIVHNVPNQKSYVFRDAKDRHRIGFITKFLFPLLFVARL